MELSLGCCCDDDVDPPPPPDPPLPPPPGGWVPGGCKTRCRDDLMPFQYSVAFPWAPTIYPLAYGVNGYIDTNGNLIASHYAGQTWIMKANSTTDCIYRSDELAWTWIPGSASIPAVAVEKAGLPICTMSMGIGSSSPPVLSRFVMLVSVNVYSAVLQGSYPFYSPIGDLGLLYAAYIEPTTDPDTGHVGINCNSAFTLSRETALEIYPHSPPEARWAFYGAEWQNYGYPSYPAVGDAYVRPATPVPATITVTPA